MLYGLNHILRSLLQDTLLMKSAERGYLSGVRKSLTKQANINIANEVYTMLIYLQFTVNLLKIQQNKL